MEIYQKKANLILILGFALFLSSVFYFQTDREDQYSTTVKTSDNEIIIDTPENKTYTEPMTGYYPATYGFENEAVGTSGTNIDFFSTDSSSSSCTATVLEEVAGHKKVVDIHDDNLAGANYLFHTFTQSTHQTVEFWIRAAQENHMMDMIYYKGSFSNAFCLRFKNDGTIWYFTEHHDDQYLFSYDANAWYHLKIEWYLGHYWRVWLNGTFSGNLNEEGAPEYIDRLYINTNPGTYGHFYLDAYGEGWDPNYQIGDNDDEGLLLDFETSVTFNWMGYSLDGQANKTITGNYTIPLPSDGSHTIKVSGTTASDIDYHSDLRYFHVYFGATEPDTPLVSLRSHIGFINLTWDPPDDNGAPILKYNVYRGIIQGGYKSYLGYTSSDDYIDTPPQNDTLYYYVINAENAVGKSDNSSEVYGQSFSQPFVEWMTPLEDATVIFPYNSSDDFNEWVEFHFEYNYGNLDNIELIIEGYNYGNVLGKEHVVLLSIHVNEIDPITAILNGYNNTMLLSTDTRHLTFVNINFEVTEVLNSNTTILGKELYLILHDPHGDNSFSGFSQTTTLSMGVGCEISSSIGMGIEIGDEFELFGAEYGASATIEVQETEEEGYDFRFEVTDTTSLVSSLVDDDPDYIGPGYGDRYWGESWIYRWILNATQRIYSNGTSRWEDPQIFYGIIRDAESFLSDEHAPPEWKVQNAVYNDTLPIEFISYFSESGGAPYVHEHEVTTTETRKRAFQIDLGADFMAKFPGMEAHLTLELNIRNYAETEQSHTHKVDYIIYDDDPADYIVQMINVDKLFGTFLFTSMPNFCNTSDPLEHCSYDYLPPEIDYPEMDYDSNNDGYGPTPSDSPIITVEIFEEGGILELIINYSTDIGAHWNILHFHEQALNPGTWEATIPAQPYNTQVTWYIMAWDNQGNKATKMNIGGTLFTYLVIAEVVTLAPAIPSYHPFLITIFMLVSVGATILIHSKKSKL